MGESTEVQRLGQGAWPQSLLSLKHAPSLPAHRLPILHYCAVLVSVLLWALGKKAK